jgi:hypothetical protein
MTRTRWLFGALFAVALSGAALARAAWLTSSPCPPHPSDHVEAPDLLDSPAAWRYRQGQPNHWRTCLLQR